MIFFDTETTGLIKNVALPLNRQPKIIEIGCIREPNIKGRSRFFEATFNPGFKLDPVITKITGLTDADLAEQPRFGEHIDDLAEFFSGETTMVAHNMPFDFQMLLFELKRELREHKFPWPTHHIDTVQLAKSHYNGKYMKLQALYEDLIGPYEQKHRAVDDARMLMEVYHALMAKANGNSSKN